VISLSLTFIPSFINSAPIIGQAFFWDLDFHGGPREAKRAMEILSRKGKNQ
jgi:hypothetical protein